MRLTRRRMLRLGLLAPPFLIVAACGGDDEPAASNAGAQASASPASTGSGNAAATATRPAATSNVQLAPTPACGDADDPTPAQTDGPFFTPNSPERASLIEAGMTGTKLVLEGYVLSTACQPVARALVDFWQCDDKGVYDNAGYRLRGHQFTDANGRYGLETIVPALYPGRTRHIHVKVQAPNRPVLTSQLYFPGEAQNQRDGIFNQALLIEDYKDASGGKAGRFTFVLNIA